MREGFGGFNAVNCRSMPLIAQALEEFLPGGSGGTGSEGRADAGRVEIVPGAGKFSAKEELSIGRS
jgi:hypothetical protein